MEQQGADVVDFGQVVEGDAPCDVPKRHTGAKMAPAAAAPGEAGPARLDLRRKVMLGVAGVLTLVWFALIGWGAVRLIGGWFF